MLSSESVLRDETARASERVVLGDSDKRRAAAAALLRPDPRAQQLDVAS